MEEKKNLLALPAHSDRRFSYAIPPPSTGWIDSCYHRNRNYQSSIISGWRAEKERNWAVALVQKKSFVFSKYLRCIIFYIQRSHESTVTIADGVQFGSIKCPFIISEGQLSHLIDSSLLPVIFLWLSDCLWLTSDRAAVRSISIWTHFM